MTKVKNLEHLKDILRGGPGEFFIQLNFGVKATKWIGYDTKRYEFWYLDGVTSATEIISGKKLMDPAYTNVGKAMKCGAFYFVKYNFQVSRKMKGAFQKYILRI